MNGTPVRSEIRADSLVQDIFKQHPLTIDVFIRNGLHCVGCCVSPFHTVADTAREYALALEPLLADLNRAVTSHGAHPDDLPPASL